ncbi:hypothetical protein FTUN_0445 [Frigoriglobus tundricola]|uniref:Uncharacterized protein n=1 Tax=Frigoriglobus tundricola TaxID=2774151 RepID=A0A6M5YFZ0_9BACT|nr:hypothetical protein FTUN_0445 [Frigoriglobus tundricola]
MVQRSLEGRTCGGCASPITREAGKRGPLPVYCGRACRWKAGNRRDAEQRARRRVGLVCETCGGTFNAGKWKRRFCSTRCCRRKADRADATSTG